MRRPAMGGLIVGLILTGGLAIGAAAQTPSVMLVEVDGPITPVVASHLAEGVDDATAAGVPLVVSLDTPGGLDTSMRDIVQTFLNASTPVIVYVEPEGARAASAGTFITMSAHVAAMAPATSIGAATPVDLEAGETASDKIINDAAAFAVSVAERRGRDVEFAEDSVRDGASITATEALERRVIDLIAADLADLLESVDGMMLDVGGTEVTLRTSGAIVERVEMSTFRKVLAQIADPNLALLFLSIGTLAVVYEAANPGMGFAGIAGIILLLLGFFALSVLPVATAGVALLILAMALFVGEIFVPGVGVLAAGGTIALILAGLFLFDGPVGVSMPVLWPTALVVGLGSAYAGRLALTARRHPATTGVGTLVGREVTVVGDATTGWSTFLDGTWWSVDPTGGRLIDGAIGTVTAVEHLRLKVEPREDNHGSEL
ncbi:MAG TPA: nodulation protein NfeD [Acidimicrobiia bacterium]|nr:nodulation protein NfeD [Acidimicrobiia bacterium]